MPFTHLALKGGSGATSTSSAASAADSSSACRLQMMMMMMVMALTVIVCCGHFHVGLELGLQLELELLVCAFNLHARCARAASLEALVGFLPWLSFKIRRLHFFCRLLPVARLFQIIIYCYYATVYGCLRSPLRSRFVLAKLMATLIYYHNNNFLAILEPATVCAPRTTPPRV